jgi:hypothetical protein
MFVLATPIVDWNAMWKIFVVALAAGAGVVVLFGFMLLGLKLSQGPATHGPHSAGADGTHSAGADGTQSAGADGARSAGTGHTPSAGARLGGFTLSLVCGLIVVGVIAVGIYAMTQKPSSKPAKPKAALVIPAGSPVMLTASSR